MRQLMLVLLALLVAGGAGLSVASAAGGSDPTTTTTTTAPATGDGGARHTAGRDQARMRAMRYLTGEVEHYQHVTWRWQRLMGRPLTDTYGRTIAKLSIEDAKKAVALWRHHARKARKRAHHPPYLKAWLCIHHYEAAWNDPGAPYYGGLQMNITFQRRYAPRLLREKGTANHWTPLEQIWVAEKARRSGRGFYPWPNTARYCGLI